MAPPRYITPAQERAAYELYRAGYSLNWIADRIYKKCGYSHQSACRLALKRSFRFKAMRTRSQATRLGTQAYFRQHNCRSCGCPNDSRTAGCETCRARHNKRLKRGPAQDSRLSARSMSSSTKGGAITKEKA